VILIFQDPEEELTEAVDPKAAKKAAKAAEKERKKKEKEDKRKAEKAAARQVLDDALVAAEEGSEEYKKAEEAIKEYEKKEEKKKFKKDMARIEELREKMKELDGKEGDAADFEEEREKMKEEIDTIQAFWKAKDDAEKEAAGPPAPEPPKGYKWGGYGCDVGGRLSAGALWDLKALLHMSARDGDVKEVKLACSIAEDSSANMVHLLLDHRSHPEQRNVFHLAAESGNVELMKFLLSYNYDISDLRDRKGATALSIATDYNHKGVVNLLRLRGMQINRQIYYDFDRQGDRCVRCDNPAVGYGGFCEL